MYLSAILGISSGISSSAELRKLSKTIIKISKFLSLSNEDKTLKIEEKLNYSKINKNHGAVYCVCFSDMCKYEKELAFYQLPYLVKENDYSGCLNYLGKSSLEIDIVCYLLEHGLISDFKKLISWVNKVYKDKKFDKKFERAFLIFVLCFLEFEEPVDGKFYDDNIEDIVFNKMLPENGAAILEVFLLVSDDGNYKSKYAAQVRTLIEDIEDDKKVIQILCGSLGAAVD